MMQSVGCHRFPRLFLLISLCHASPAPVLHSDPVPAASLPVRFIPSESLADVGRRSARAEQLLMASVKAALSQPDIAALGLGAHASSAVSVRPSKGAVTETG